MSDRVGNFETGLHEAPLDFTPTLPVTCLPDGAEPTQTLHVLLVEDAPKDEDLIPFLLDRAPSVRFAVLRANSAETALRRLAGGGIDVCLIDQDLPGRDGLDLVRLIQARGFDVPLLLVSGEATFELEAAAIEAGLDDFLDKEELDAGRLERSLRFAAARCQRDRLRERAGQFDPLTGLARMVLFEDRVARAVGGARRRGGRVALAVVDLSGIETVDERLGPEAAAKVLKVLADRLCGRLRETDTVARMGGRTWGVLLENMARAEDAALVAAKILATLDQAVEIEGETVTVVPALGIAVFPEDMDDPADMLRLAGESMREAKAAGRRLGRPHAPAAATPIGMDVRAAEFEAAMADGRLFLRYRPQLTLASPMIGLAAVPCLKHHRLGTLEGGVVRTLVESLGLHEPFTWWMAETGAKQLAAWAAAGMPCLHLAVPLVARRNLAWTALADHAAATLDRLGIDRHRIEFELDEARIQHEMVMGGKGLAQLRDAGLRLALVGFGEGPASLTLLRDAPIDTVRLSPVLLEGVPHDRHRIVFLETVMHLVRMSQMRLVAEGADNPAQLRLLKRAGCHAVQGAVGEPPLGADECGHWLRQALRRRA